MVVIQPDPSGDFKDLLHPKPADPGDRPLKCTKQEMKDWKQLKAKHTAWTKLHTDFEGLVTTRVTAAIHAAETQLHLTGPLHVSVKSLYHRSRTDDLHHWTFSFSAPACGAGRCVGHAYEAGAVNGRQARIFSSAHVPIFGVSLLSKIVPEALPNIRARPKYI